MYKTFLDPQNENVAGVILNGNIAIPLDPANTDYQHLLKTITLEGSGCFDGDIPAKLQSAADAVELQENP